jgi:hypothetical protein
MKEQQNIKYDKDSSNQKNKVDYRIFTFLAAMAIVISYADRSNLSTAM